MSYKTLQLTIKVDKKTGAIKVAQGEFNSLSNTTKRATKEIHNFKSTLAGIAKGAVAIYGIKQAFDLTVNSIKLLTSTAGSFETFKTTLKTLEGSAQKAEKSFEWIKTFTKNTPYELKEVMTAFNKAKAYGIDPTQGALKTLGDTASAMGKDINQGVEALADAMTGENERLKEFGIKAKVQGEKVAYSFIDASGKAKEVIVKNNAQIIESTLLSIFNSKYENAMKERMQTYEGLVSNFNDLKTAFLDDLAQSSGAFEGFKSVLKEVNKKFEELTDNKEKMQQFGTVTRQSLGLIVTAMSGVIKTGVGIAYIFETMQTIGENVVSAIVYAFLKLKRAGIETMLEFQKSARSALPDFAKDTFGVSNKDIKERRLELLKAEHEITQQEIKMRKRVIQHEDYKEGLVEIINTTDSLIDTFKNVTIKQSEAFKTDSVKNNTIENNKNEKSIKKLTNTIESFNSFSSKKSKKIEDETKAFKKNNEVMQEYYEKIGDYEQAWIYESAKISEKYKKLKKEDFIKIFTVSKEEYFDRFKKTSKDTFEESARHSLKYFETVRDYTKSWNTQEQILRKQHKDLLENLTQEEVANFLNAQEKKYSSSFYSYENLQTQEDGYKHYLVQMEMQTKTHGQNVADIMLGVNSSMQKGFENFFDYTSKSFLDLEDLAKSVGKSILDNMVKQTLVNPLAKAGSSIINAGIDAGLSSVGEYLGFANGGYTPYAKSDDVAVGVVHANEYVVPANIVRSEPYLINTLEALRTGKRGFRRGGLSSSRHSRRQSAKADRLEKARDRFDKQNNKESGWRDKLDRDNGGESGGYGHLSSSYKREHYGDSITKKTGDFLQDTVFSAFGSLLGAIGGPIGAKVGAVAFKKISDWMQKNDLSLGSWADGKVDDLVDGVDDLEKQTAKMKGLPNTSKAITNLKKDLMNFKEKDGDKKTAKLNHLLKENNTKIDKALQSDTLGFIKQAQEKMFLTVSTDIKNYQKNWRNILKQFNEGGQNKILDDVLKTSSPETYKIWEKYAKEKKTDVEKALSAAFKNIDKTKNSFTQFLLKDNPLELAKTRMEQQQNTLKEFAKSIGVDSAKITKESFLDEYNKAIKNSFDPKTIENWDKLKDVLINATNAQEQYANAQKNFAEQQHKMAMAAIQASQNAYNAQINFMNALGQNSSKLSLEAKKSEIFNWALENTTNDDEYKNKLKEWGQDKAVNYWKNKLIEMNNGSGSWGGYGNIGDYLNAGENKKLKTEFVNKIASLISLEKQIKEANNKSNSYTPISVSNSSYKSVSLFTGELDKLIKKFREGSNYLKQTYTTSSNVIENIFKDNSNYQVQQYKKYLNKAKELNALVKADPYNVANTKELFTNVNKASSYVREYLNKDRFKSSLDYKFAQQVTANNFKDFKQTTSIYKQMETLVEKVEQLADIAKTQADISVAIAKLNKESKDILNNVVKGRQTLKMENVG